MKGPTLGEGVDLDVGKLIAGRLLIQANSGGGKSYAVRRILEQTHGLVPHIVFDPEDELHTLREKHDYVLAGPGGDAPATVRSAPLVARRVLELRTSIIINLYELGAARQAYVAAFLSALVRAPRSLWSPFLVVIEEAQKYAPEADRTPETLAVIEFMTLGRKRGFAGVLATQRVSMLSKSAAAECVNRMIGRTGQDVDQERAARELGMPRSRRGELRDLAPGEFFVLGPAFGATSVQRVKVGGVHTTHPEPGSGLPPTPARHGDKSTRAEFAGLDAEAETDARTEVDLRAKVRDLERQLAARPAPDTKLVERPVVRAEDLATIDRISADLRASLDTSSKSILDAIGELRERIVAAAPARAPEAPRGRPSPTPRPGAPPRPATSGPVPIPAGEAAVLRALIQYPAGLRREQIGVLTGYKRSTRDSYIARLRERLLVEADRDLVRATAGGIDALPDAEPLPTGADLREWWAARLPAGERVVLDVLVAAYPAAVARADLDAPTGFKRSTRDTYLSRLAARELVVEAGRGEVRASETLFDGGSR